MKSGQICVQPVTSLKCRLAPSVHHFTFFLPTFFDADDPVYLCKTFIHTLLLLPLDFLSSSIIIHFFGGYPCLSHPSAVYSFAQFDRLLNAVRLVSSFTFLFPLFSFVFQSHPIELNSVTQIFRTTNWFDFQNSHSPSFCFLKSTPSLVIRLHPFFCILILIAITHSLQVAFTYFFFSSLTISSSLSHSVSRSSKATRAASPFATRAAVRSFRIRRQTHIELFDGLRSFHSLPRRFERIRPEITDGGCSN